MQNLSPDDPGTEYRFKIDEQFFTSIHRLMTGEAILALAGKKPSEYELQIFRKEDGITEAVHIRPDETIDLSHYGIEYFITKKIYLFYIDRKDYKTTEEYLTPREILEKYAGVDPENKVLAEKQGEIYHEFSNLDEKIDLRTVHHFTIMDKEPVGKS